MIVSGKPSKCEGQSSTNGRVRACAGVGGRASVCPLVLLLVVMSLYDIKVNVCLSQQVMEVMERVPFTYKVKKRGQVLMS